MKRAVVIIAAAFAVASFSSVRADGDIPEGCELREGEIHPDWASICTEGGSLAIPAGQTWVAYESDMQYVNKLKAWGGLSISKSSTLVLDNTTTWIRSQLTGYLDKGTIVKRGASTLTTNSGQIFAGTFIIENGVFNHASHYPFLPNQTSTKVIIRAGGTYRMNIAAPSGPIEIVAEGNGYNGQGAILIDQMKGWGQIGRLTLSNDTYIVQNVNGCAFSRYDVRDASPGNYTIPSDPSEYKLNGYKLKVGGTATTVGFDGIYTVGDGEIEIEALANSATRTVRINREASLASADLLTLKGDADIQFYDNQSVAQTVPISAEGNLKFSYAQSTTFDPPLTNESFCVWSGPISVADGKTLTIATGGTGRRITLSGAISGNCDLQVGTSSSSEASDIFLLGNNTYTGSTTIYGASSGRVFLGSQASIPDFTSLTLNGGGLYARPRYGESGLTWDAPSILNLAKSVGTSTICVDTTHVTNATDLTFSSAAVSAAFPSLGLTWNGRGNGAGYTLTGPYESASPLNLDIDAGTVRLSGADSISLGTAVVRGTSATSSGTLVIDGAGDVAYGDEPFVIGTLSTDLRTPVPRVVVTNSVIRSTSANSCSDVKTGALIVGSNSAGILEVYDGAVISNKLVVGGNDSTSFDGFGVGAVYQRGGLVVPRGTAGSEGWLSNIGHGGHGYYELSGGTLRPVNILAFANNGTAVFLQTGGEAIFPKGASHCIWQAAGRETFTILDGTCTTLASWTTCKGLGGVMNMTISGKNSHFDASVASYSGLLYFAQSAKNYRITMNLSDSGRITLGGCYLYQASYQNDYPLIFNFNGGILKNMGWTSPFGANGSKHPAKVVVYGKGATFETDNANRVFNNMLGVLTAEKEGGIQSIALPEGGLTGYVAAPFVDITGDGYGASATALLDSRTATITNILVTSHGWGYDPSTTTIKLIYGSAQYLTTVKYTFPSEAVTIGANDVGGITMKGPGTFELMYTNAWEKWTAVVGGKLKATCDWAIPSNTVLTISNGATLDLNGKRATFAGLGGNGGTVMSGSVVLEDGATVSAKQFISRETTAVAGTVDLSGVSEICLADAECLDESAAQLRGLDLFRATQIVMPSGGVAVTGVPNGFRAVLHANGLRLAPERGAVLIIR